MENNIQQSPENTIITDLYNDEYWVKTYGVSAEELKETSSTSLSDKIIQISTKNKEVTN